MGKIVVDAFACDQCGVVVLDKSFGYDVERVLLQVNSHTVSTRGLFFCKDCGEVFDDLLELLNTHHEQAEEVLPALEEFVALWKSQGAPLRYVSLMQEKLQLSYHAVRDLMKQATQEGLVDLKTDCGTVWDTPGAPSKEVLATRFRELRDAGEPFTRILPEEFGLTSGKIGSMLQSLRKEGLLPAIGSPENEAWNELSVTRRMAGRFNG